MRRVASLALTLCLAAGAAAAHPGGLDRQGCHTDRRSGTYHCHRNAAPPPAPRQPATGGPGLYFRNCAEARAAGHRRIRRGEPGYRPGLDRDNDGIACE